MEGEAVAINQRYQPALFSHVPRMGVCAAGPVRSGAVVSFNCPLAVQCKRILGGSGSVAVGFFFLLTPLGIIGSETTRKPSRWAKGASICAKGALDSRTGRKFA